MSANKKSGAAPRRSVELPRSSYRPTPSDLQEKITLPSGTTLGQFAKKLVEPVDILRTDKPRRR